MAGARRLTVEILGDAKGLMGAFGDAAKGADSLGTQFADFGKKVGVAFMGAATGLGFLAKGALDAAYESQKVAAQTEAIIKSTGEAAGMTAKQVGKLAESLSYKTGIDDEQIQTSMNMLLTFKQVANQAGKGNDVFNRASALMLDLGNVFGSTDAAAMQLGKALSDPVKGVGALARAGVNFTAQQKAQIKTLVESGNILEAQKIILGEVESQVGGTAAASATAADRMKVAFGNLQEKAGALLIPVFEKFSTVLVEKIIPAIEALATEYGPKVRQWFSDLKDRVEPVVVALRDNLQPWLEKFGQWVKDNKDTVGVFFGVVIGSVAVAAVIGLASALLALLSPVVLIIGAIALVAAGVYYAYTHFETFRNIVDGVVRFITDTAMPALGAAFKWIYDYAVRQFEALKQMVEGVLNVIMGVFDVFIGLLTGDWGRAWDGLKQVVSGALDAVLGFAKYMLNPIITAFDAIWEGIKAGMSGIFDGLAGAFKWSLNTALGLVESGINGAIGLLNTALNGIDVAAGPYVNFGEIPSVSIPKLASGGIVTAPTLALVGEAGPEAVVPLSKGAGMGMGDVNVYVTVEGTVTSERDLVSTIYDGLLKLQKRQGPLGFAA